MIYLAHRRKHFAGPYNPEAGLTLTGTVAAGAAIPSSTYNISGSVVFGCDLTIPATPAGLIWEQGAAGNGSYVGFRSDNSFVARAAGSASAPTSSVADTAVVWLSAGSAPAGTGTMVWAIDPDNETIRVWWKGTLLGTGVAPSGFSTWAGTNDGTYLASGSVAAGENSSGLPAGSPSTLRYYNNQKVA